MTTVTAMTAEATEDLFNASVVDAALNSTGHLILTRGDASTEDIGDVKPTGRELAAQVSAAVQTGISTTPIDITGLSITFTVTTRPVIVMGELPWVIKDGTAGLCILSICDAAGTAQRDSARTLGISEIHSMTVTERIVTPGTYTRKLQLVRSTGGGVVGNNANARTVSSIVAIER